MWPSVQEPQSCSIREPGRQCTLCVHIPALPPKNAGWGPIAPARQLVQRLGRPSSVCEMGAPLTQLTPGHSSDLELPVTYFPLLLFLEVLMSMQNSAERPREKRDREKRGRRRERMKEGSGKREPLDVR